MTRVWRTVKIFLLISLMNVFALIYFLNFSTLVNTLFCVIGIIFFITINIKPQKKENVSKRLVMMINGYELVVLFNFTLLINIVLNILFWINLVPTHLSSVTLIINAIICLIFEIILILNGMARVFLTSIQLGIKWRVLIVFLWWIPILNIILLIKILGFVKDEYIFEKEKIELLDIQKENEICKTKYPLLLVHGVFFRDVRFLNYWGRIPKELKRNGATVYYGEQESATSVENSGMELAIRIEAIVKESGCEKLNIFAHSKGGIDARYAISCCGASKYVASLTSINAPHKGCVFAEYLLKNAPMGMMRVLAKRYNATLKKLGDKNPDFIEGVRAIAKNNCMSINEIAPDIEGVYYQSIISKMKKVTSGKFPMNLSYILVKKFDGENDGLVSVESQKHGKTIFVDTVGRRGISHADMIDFHKENIKGFDVRAFYVETVKSLKEMQF